MSDSRDQVFPGPTGPSRLRRIVLEFESFRDFIQAFSPVVSEEGMFVAAEKITDELPSVGEEIEFEVTLTDDFRLVNGRGEVAWVRTADDSPADAGVAVRFLDLDEPSRRLVSRLLTNYTKDGGQVFELATPTVAPDMAVEPEPLARSEADELFTPDADLLSSDPEILDAVTPEVDELPPPPLGDIVDQDSIPTMALDVEQLKADQEEVPELPLTPSEGPSIEESAEVSLPMVDQSPVELGGDSLPPVEFPDAPVPSMPAEESAAAAPVIPDPISQIADELSGVNKVQPVEMPTEQDQISLAGTGRVADEQPAWRTPLIASLAGIVVAIAAWYFLGDQIKGLIGMGGTDGETPVVVAEAPVAEDEAPATGPAEEEGEESAGDATEPVAAASEVDGDQQAVEPSEPAAEPAREAIAESSAREVPRDVPSEVASRSASAISEVERITWTVQNGKTVVSIVLDGNVTDGDCEVVRIRQGAPREVIKISGVAKPFSPPQLDVGSAQVSALRTGVHSSAGGSEIHVVADLTGPAVAVTLVRTEGRTVFVTFS
jgi:Tfp pilus assembly protein PilZ